MGGSGRAEGEAGMAAHPLCPTIASLRREVAPPAECAMLCLPQRRETQRDMLGGVAYPAAPDALEVQRTPALSTALKGAVYHFEGGCPLPQR